ncbi:protocatechuate 3,4-dioxygenase subunit alpha [Roseitranquillus sediminis]|uniref:protocatechuate 3,4-dioxygenase subunit alpha n=1 Tax=Roseitranquillus sediminis TaxID=2809051 RepID=UPI001D0C1C21|nr:protocatechuate 3,4-dioxygenase subunit alpha [Roseitranquillus sediminis]MBM9593088.1 protocatechuate 3,4-dioxygenase subunit alpha [Roseitranquillus sediminis]
MVQKLETFHETPSQTAGPYVHIGCTPNFIGVEGIYSADLGAADPFPDAGDTITLVGRVIDGTGTPLRDCMVEFWQADGGGRYRPGQGFARRPADAETGEWRLVTVKPGRVPFSDKVMQAPHIAVWIAARGINLGLHTRIYFEDEDNDGDPLLGRIELRHRVPTLVARRDGGVYRHDIVLKGEGETVFLDI